MRETISRYAAIYWGHFKVWISLQMQYRVAMLIWMIGLVLGPVIYLVVWVNVADASGGSVNSYDAAGFAAYFIGVMIVDHLTFTWHMWEYDYIIRQGKLSPRLLRPMHPIHADIAENLAYKVLTSVVMLPTVLLMVLAFRPSWQPVGWSLLAFVPSVILAFFIRFFVGWALAISAFWTTRIMALNRMYFLGKLFFAGMIAPLTLLPPLMFKIALLTPYPWTVYFPVQLLLGQFTPQEAIQGLLVQLFWVLVSVTAVYLLWRAGVKRYSAFGA